MRRDSSFIPYTVFISTNQCIMRRQTKLLSTLLALSFGLIGCKPGTTLNENLSKVTEIKVTPETVTLQEENTLQLKAVLTPENASNATELVWYIAGDPTVAEILPSGLLTALKKGSTKIICRVGAVTKEVPVSVTEKPLTEFGEATQTSVNVLKAVFEVKPKNKDAYYTAGVIAEKTLNGPNIGGLEGLPQNEKTWWSHQPGEGAERFKPFWFNGDKTYDSSSHDKNSAHYLLYWDADYLFYAFEVNEKTGNPSSKIYTQKFKTPKPTKSDITFDIKLNNDNTGKFSSATVTPSKKTETWIYRVEPKSTWDSWKEKGYKGRYTNPDENIIFEYISTALKQEDSSGKLQTIDKILNTGDMTISDLYRPLTPNREYVFLVFGWDKDKGPTTGITASEQPFTVKGSSKDPNSSTTPKSPEAK